MKQFGKSFDPREALIKFDGPNFDVNAKKLENVDNNLEGKFIPTFKNGRVDNFDVPFSANSDLDPKMFEPVEDNLEHKFGFGKNDAKYTQLKELAKKRSELLKKLNELGNQRKPQNFRNVKSVSNIMQILDPNQSKRNTKKTRQQQTMVKKKYALLRAFKPELTLMVNPNPIDYNDSMNEAGIRAYIHKVNETANYEDGLNIGSHVEALITLENEGKQMCKPSKKSKDESHSNASGNYSRNACIMECRAKMFKHKCKCLPYFLLNMTMTQAKSCNHNGLKCIAEVYGNKDNLVFSLQVTNPFSFIIGNNTGTNCDCPLECHSDAYGISMTSASMMDDSNMMKMLKMEGNILKELENQIQDMSDYSHSESHLPQQLYHEIEESSSVVHFQFNGLFTKPDQSHLHGADASPSVDSRMVFFIGLGLAIIFELVYWFLLRHLIDRRRRQPYSRRRNVRRY